MTPAHNASSETLAAFAAGTLDEGQRLVVAMHLSLSAQSRAVVHGLEHLGGDLLNDIEPEPLALHTRAQVLDEAASGSPVHERVDARGWEAMLAQYPVGPWRWIGPGVHFRTVDVDGESRVLMLRGQPGIELPHHKHSDIEWTCVLQGAFRHNAGRYGQGDFDEADESVEHHPVVEEGDTCICIVALRGRIEFQGLIGRLLQPFVRI